MTASANITPAQAQAICNVLNDAGMDVTVTDHRGRPAFTGATGAEILAAAMVVTATGGFTAVNMPTPTEWLMVTFEAGADSIGRWSSLELGWTE